MSIGLILHFGGTESCKLFLWTLYLDGRGRMFGIRVLLQGAISEVPQDAQQRDKNNSQTEGDGAAGRMF